MVVVVVLRQGRLSTNGYGRHILCTRACVCACVRASGIPSEVWTLPFFLTTLDEINLKNLTHTGNRLRRAPPMLLDSLRQASRCLPPTLKGARVTITYPNRQGYFLGPYRVITDTVRLPTHSLRTQHCKGASEIPRDTNLQPLENTRPK